MADVAIGDLATQGGLKPTAVGSGFKFPERGLFILPIHIKDVFQGDKTIIIKAKPYKISGESILITKEFAHGIVKLSEAKKIGIKEFKELESQHLIKPAARKKYWPTRKNFWAYKVMSLKIFAEAIPIEPIEGSPIMTKSVKLKFEGTPSMFELAKGEADSLMNFGAWLRVLAAKSDLWNQSVFRFMTEPEEAIDAIKKFLVIVKSHACSFDFAGGEAADGVSLLKALEETIAWGKKATEAVRGTEHANFADDISSAVETFEEVGKIIEPLKDVKDA